MYLVITSFLFGVALWLYLFLLWRRRTDCYRTTQGKTPQWPLQSFAPHPLSLGASQCQSDHWMTTETCACSLQRFLQPAKLQHVVNNDRLKFILWEFYLYGVKRFHCGLIFQSVIK